MKSDEIYNKWTVFVEEYKQYFNTKVIVKAKNNTGQKAVMNCEYNL